MTNGPVKSQPARSSRPASIPSEPGRPAALTAACLLGLLGALLLMVGVFSGVSWLLLVGLAVGCCSLASALVWRSQLIEAWQAKRRAGQ